MAGPSAADVAAADRLHSSSDMKDVWRELRRLAAQTSNELLPLEFETIASALRGDWARLSKTPTSEAKTTLKDIEKTARHLSRQLRAHRAEIELFAGYETDLRSLVYRTLKSEGRSTTARRLRHLESQQQWRSLRSVIPTHPEVLQRLADLLKDGQKEKPRRPTKVGDENAERTFCVQRLAAFLKEKTGQAHPTLIARTVSALLDLREPLTADHVAHLIRR
jgi:hypothetical protein